MNVIEQCYAVLSLMERFKKIEGRTRFQKLVFLLDNKNELGFGFIKSEYGAFSSRLCDIIENMTRDGWIKEVEVVSKTEKKRYEYDIQPEGIKQLEFVKELSKGSPTSSRISAWLQDIESRKLQSMDLVELLRLIYKEYPAFAGDYFKKK